MAVHARTEGKTLLCMLRLLGRRRLPDGPRQPLARQALELSPFPLSSVQWLVGWLAGERADWLAKMLLASRVSAASLALVLGPSPAAAAPARMWSHAKQVSVCVSSLDRFGCCCCRHYSSPKPSWSAARRPERSKYIDSTLTLAGILFGFFLPIYTSLSLFLLAPAQACSSFLDSR